MYKSIYVPVDNSDHSNRAVACSMALGKAFSAKLVGCHVYAAKLHDYRFRQMEYTMREEYIDEGELERQRKIHDSLITMRLKLISDSYLDGMSRLCGESGLAFEPRMMDGKHHIEILKDLAGSQHDLVVIGAVGIGRARDSVIGSVCERVSRQSDRDVWVVKHVPEPSEPERDTILVGMDGSPQSFGALMTAVDLARTFGKKVEAIAVYDPYLHYSVFNGIARTGVLRLALEKGHSVITSAVIDEAMDRFMPKSASAATKALAEAVALERAKAGPVLMCRACGVTATQSDPVKCTVCGA